ncbi:hypothetical protein [Microcoleus sp. CZ3-B2]
MIATINYGVSSFFWVLMASKANTTPLSAICSIKAGIAGISWVFESTS